MKPLERATERRDVFFPGQGGSDELPAELGVPFNVQKRTRKRQQEARRDARGVARTRLKRELRLHVEDQEGEVAP